MENTVIRDAFKALEDIEEIEIKPKKVIKEKTLKESKKVIKEAKEDIQVKYLDDDTLFISTDYIKDNNVKYTDDKNESLIFWVEHWFDDDSTHLGINIYDNKQDYVDTEEVKEGDSTFIKFKKYFNPLMNALNKELENSKSTQSTSIKEGAEGKKTPGCKWVAFDDKTDKIVLVRTTYTEIKHAISKYLENHKETKLTPELVKEECAIKGKDIKDCKFCNEEVEHKDTLVEKPDMFGVETDDELDTKDKTDRDDFEKQIQAQRDEFEKRLKSRRDDVSKKRSENEKFRALRLKITDKISFDELFDLLVPDYGKSETLAGELVRALNKIECRWYNGGERFFEADGLETCGDSAAFIDTALSELNIDSPIIYSEPMYEIAEDNLDDTEYEKAIEEVKSQLVELIVNNVNDLIVSNEKDMFDIDGEKYWDDLGVIPTYTVICEIPRNIIEHIRYDHINEEDVTDEVISILDSFTGASNAEVSLTLQDEVKITDIDSIDTYSDLDNNLYDWLTEYGDRLDSDFGDLEESLTEDKKVNLRDEDEIKKGKEFLNKSEEENIEQVVDVNADTIDKLKDSYIGNAILQCNVCKTLIYKEPDDLVKDEESTDETYNVEDICPHCGGQGGYSLVGQVSSLEIESDEQDITTENPEEQPEKEFETTDDNEIPTKRPSLITDESLVENFDENKFDTLINKYVKSTYKNVKEYKTVKGSIDNLNNIIVEGIIKYKSGKQIKTKFMLEHKNMSKTGKHRYVGLNETFTKNKKPFIFVGTINNNKLMCESMTYKYNVKVLNEDKLVKGKVSINEKTKLR